MINTATRVAVLLFWLLGAATAGLAQTVGPMVPGGGSGGGGGGSGPTPGPPVVTLVSPNQGVTTGGSTTAIAGANLSTATAVSFGANPATSFTILNGVISAVVPAGSLGVVDVTVTTPLGISPIMSSDKFTYVFPAPPPAAPTVALVTPNNGLSTGGLSVSIVGENLTGATGVSFGSTVANFGDIGGAIVAVSPPGSVGTVDVTVTTSLGTSPTSSVDQFTYTSGTTPLVLPTELGAGFAMTGQINLLVANSKSLAQCCSFSVVQYVSNTTNSSAFYTNTFGSTTGAAFTYSSGNGLYNFTTAPGGNFTCGVNRACVPTSAINNGSPHVLITTYNAGESNTNGTASIYVDGVLQSQQGTPSSFSPNIEPWGMYRSITGQVYLTVWYAGRALAQSDVTAWQTAITSNSLPAYGTALMTNVVGYWAGPAIGNAIPNLVTNNDVGPLIFDTNPIVAVTNPTSAATLTGSVSLAATASNSGGFPIQSVSFQVDGLTVCTAPQTASPFSCSYNTAISVDGPHAFTATATDTAGLSTISAAISATTNNSTMGKTYFFAAAGSDAANCQTTGTACQTITKLNSIIGSVGIGESDTVSFNGGDSFAGCITLTAANTRSNLTYPATFTSYGTGRYTITQNCAFAGTSGAILINGASGLVIENGNLVAAAPALSTRAGLYITNTTNTVGAGNITVQNMQISGFTGLNGGGGCTDFGGEIMVDGAESSAGLTNISLLDNILNGSSTTSSDDNGIDGFADGQNIITANYQGNDVHYVGGSAGCGFIGNGIIFDGVASGTASFNLTHDNGGNNNHCGGPAGQWTAQVNVISIKFGESYNMLGLPGACDGDGFDIDEQSQNVTTEYNYSHDNYGDSFPSYFTAPWTGNQYRYNISEHDTQLHGGGVGCISMTNAGSLVYYAYNNTCWMDTPNPSLAGLRPGGFAFCCNLNDVTTATGAIANNFLGVTENDQNAVLFMANNGGALAFPNIPFKSNWYYNITGTGATQWIYGAIYSSLSAWKAAVPGGDTNAGTTTANFTAAGSDQTCSWTPATIVTWPPSGCPTGYVLLNTSPLLNNGIDMMATYGINPGAQDYYGNAIPRSGPLNNTGADGGNP